MKAHEEAYYDWLIEQKNRAHATGKTEQWIAYQHSLSGFVAFRTFYSRWDVRIKRWFGFKV